MLKFLRHQIGLPLVLGLLAPISAAQLSQAAERSIPGTPTPITSSTSPSPLAPTPIPQPSSKPLLQPLFKPSAAPATVEQPIRLEISRSQRRVTLYEGDVAVKSYAIAVGKAGWETPLGTWRVQQKLRNPRWIHPFTGESVKGGDPENPLGRYWIGFWTNGKNWIGFHGTPNPESVGKAASHGCVRMYDRDVEELFQKVSLGTPVKVTP